MAENTNNTQNTDAQSVKLSGEEQTRWQAARRTWLEEARVEILELLGMEEGDGPQWLADLALFGATRKLDGVCNTAANKLNALEHGLPKLENLNASNRGGSGSKQAAIASLADVLKQIGDEISNSDFLAAMQVGAKTQRDVEEMIVHLSATYLAGSGAKKAKK
jgi:hypothetical protein